MLLFYDVYVHKEGTESNLRRVLEKNQYVLRLDSTMQGCTRTSLGVALRLMDSVGIIVISEICGVAPSLRQSQVHQESVRASLSVDHNNNRDLKARLLMQHLQCTGFAPGDVITAILNISAGTAQFRKRTRIRARNPEVVYALVGQAKRAATPRQGAVKGRHLHNLFTTCPYICRMTRRLKRNWLPFMVLNALVCS